MEVPTNYEELQLQAEADISRLNAQRAQIDSEIANVRLRVHQDHCRMAAKKLEHHMGLEVEAVRHLKAQPAYGIAAGTTPAKAVGRPKNSATKAAAPADSGAKPKRVMTEAGRQRIAAAQKARWDAMRAKKAGGK